MHSERDQRFDYFNQEDVALVIRRYEEMIRLNKVFFFDVGEFEMIINYFLDKDKYDNAEKAITYCERQHPSATLIQLKKAEIYIEQGEALKALNLCRKLIKLEPSNYELLVLLGNSYMLLGNIDSANTYFEKAIEFAFENTEDIAYNIGYAYEKLTRYDLAVKYYLIALENNKTEKAYVFDLAFCLEQLKRFEESEAFYKKYIDLDPLSDSAWYNLGVVLNKQNKDKDAMEAYEYAIAINQTNSSAIFNLANTLANNGKEAEAIELYKEFVELEPDSVPGNYYIGDCFLKDGELDKAKKYFRICTELESEYSDAYYGLSMVEYLRKNYVDSLTLLEDALKYNNECSEYWSLLGDLNVKFNYLDLAETSYKKALSLDPEDEKLISNYINLLLDQEKQNEALNIILKTKKKLGSNSKFQFKAATVYFLMGEKQTAMEFLLKAVQSDPRGISELYHKFPQAKFDEDVKELLRIYQA